MGNPKILQSGYFFVIDNFQVARSRFELLSPGVFSNMIQSLESLVPWSLTARFGTNVVVFIGSTGLHELPLS